MSNESNDVTIGPIAGFKVKIKGSGKGPTYLTSGDNGATLTWSTTGTPVCFDGTQASPKTWNITYTDNRNNKVTNYLSVSGTAVQVRGDRQDDKWQAVTNDKVSYQDNTGTQYLNQSATGNAVLAGSGQDIDFDNCT